MPKKWTLSTRKQSKQPSSIDDHHTRGPAAHTPAYHAQKQREHQSRVADQSTVDDEQNAAESLFDLAYHTSEKLSSPVLTSSISSADKSMLEKALERLLRPHQPACGEAGGLQRSSSGDKAVNDILDMFIKLASMVDESKAEAKQQIAGLDEELQTALEE